MLSKKLRLNKSWEYRKVFALGKSYVSHLMVIYIWKDLPEKELRIGFITSKKIGNSVRRNRAKRLMREAARRNLDRITDPCRIICIARPPINKATLGDVEKALQYLWKKGGIL